MSRHNPLIFTLEFGVFFFALGVMIRIIIVRMFDVCSTMTYDMHFCTKVGGATLFSQILVVVGLVLVGISAIGLIFKSIKRIKRKPIKGFTKTCENCKKQIPERADFCLYCGEKCFNSDSD